ncbi:unnamed protein product [Caenorhabditis angaria]|uniref:Uncharacterized protein n=1 Tax=Caenorhabditis angaria TaxID=860376 RepID=A0A9P1IMA7_9PELO|nr:unnamed protein product [Caenorhabditis angaria]
MSSQLYYNVNDIPTIPAILLFGFQQMMICLSTLLVVPYFVANMLCAGDYSVVLRVQLIAATFVVSGIATILQSTFGLRLSILHGPSFAFLPALQTFQESFPCTTDTDTTQWQYKVQLISGSCMLAVLLMPLLGLTGLIGFLSRHIGPITIVPMMTLLTISTVPSIEQKMALHWISIVEFLMLIVFIVLLEEWKFYMTRQRILSQFPYLIGISIAWFICFILTVTNLEPPNGNARTDNNESLSVLETTPWFQVPLPGRYGPPKFNVALFCGFLSGCLAAMIESLGDYNLCAKISEQDRIPASNVNRAFCVEGIGCLLASSLGIGTGIVTYSENIAIMSVTKVSSRITMQVAGCFLIIAGIITKFAAFLAMIPEAIIGGIFAMGVCMINGCTLSNLQSVDLRLSRNLTIMGIAVIMGFVIPDYFNKNPWNTQNITLNDVLQTLSTTQMLVGGFLACILDNITPGANRLQRGFRDENSLDRTPIENNGYVFPSYVNNFILKFPFLTYFPVFPSKFEILGTESRRRNTKL